MTCRSLLLLGALAGCNINSSPPLLYISTVPYANSLSIELARDPNYDFSGSHASVNGIDLGAAQVDEGSTGHLGTGDGGSLANAMWLIPLAQVGTSAHIVVEDGGEIDVDLPTINAPRTATVATSRAAPLVPGSSLAATTGVPSDVVAGSFIVELPDGTPCLSQFSDQNQPAILENPAVVDGEWTCGAVPAPGTLFSGTLDVILDVTPQFTCTGDGVTCESVTVPQLETTMPVKVQF
jgi:hypothetical protein